jgi:hypothetical protein
MDPLDLINLPIYVVLNMAQYGTLDMSTMIQNPPIVTFSFDL